jgi:hypothetical protein
MECTRAAHTVVQPFDPVRKFREGLGRRDILTGKAICEVWGQATLEGQALGDFVAANDGDEAHKVCIVAGKIPAALAEALKLTAGGRDRVGIPKDAVQFSKECCWGA